MDVEAYFSDSSSEDAEIAASVQQTNGGIQPYRFEPTLRRIEGEEHLDTENATATGTHEDEEEDPGDDDNPFTHAIDFEARLTIHVSEWCTCDRCVTMTTPVMNLCCQELEALEGKIYADDLDSITLHCDFELVVLKKPILRTALVAMKDVKRASLVEPITERAYRLAAYRQFTWWIHERLGKKVRKVIPSCVVQLIRETFQDPNGQYTGFREADETETVYPD
ncbi:uncharacterized protein LOC135494328 [Lineus longissimus]|uniref:uncharacterized protein LOC135494328 n=1 Tax=Lineus longissimus TaxID=88925 RepID=UPI00315D6BCF